MTFAPTAANIRTVRQAAALTQAQAAVLVHVTLRAWQYWESGTRPIDPAHWELFQLKVCSPLSSNRDNGTLY